MPLNRQESGIAGVMYLVGLGVMLLGPAIVWGGLFAATATWGWLTRPPSPDPPLQSVHSQQAQPGRVGPSPEQVSTDQELP